jgi:hypothetical protein
MATTLTLRNSMNFVSAFLKNAPQMVNNLEPALTAANIVLGTMLGPPMRWRFNRRQVSFGVTTAGGTDYIQAVPDFGFLETQWLTDASGNVHQLEGRVTLAIESHQGMPTRIAPQYDDNAGNITFRVANLPDAAYTIYGDYQRKMERMSSDASSWGTVPDEFEYIFNQGFLSLMMLIVNDARFPIFEQYFVSRLLGAQDGLTDQERNIFVANWLALSTTLARGQGAANSGISGRGK